MSVLVGMARFGAVGRGNVRFGRQGRDRSGKVRLGAAGLAWCGSGSQVGVRPGLAGAA